MEFLSSPFVWALIAAIVATGAVAFLRGRNRGWLHGLSLRQQRRIEDIARAYFERRGKKVRVENGQVTLDSEDEEERSEFGLLNLHQMSMTLAQAPESEWENLAASFFAAMLASRHEMAEFEKDEHDFEKAKKFLAVRIWPEEFLQLPRGKDYDGKNLELICRRHMEGLLSVLVYDFPSGIRQVLPDVLAKWSKTEEEAFAAAEVNMRESVPRDYKIVAGEGEAPIYLFADENFLTASRALLLDDTPEVLGKAGAVIGIPTRQIMLVLPLSDESALERLAHLVMLVLKLGNGQPGQISDQVFWFHDGRYVRLPYEFDAKKMDLKMVVPEEFETGAVALLKDAVS